MKDDGYYKRAWREMEGMLERQIDCLSDELEEAEKGRWEYVQAYLKGRMFSLDKVLRHVRDVIETERNGR